MRCKVLIAVNELLSKVVLNILIGVILGLGLIHDQGPYIYLCRRTQKALRAALVFSPRVAPRTP